MTTYHVVRDALNDTLYEFTVECKQRVLSVRFYDGPCDLRGRAVDIDSVPRKVILELIAQLKKGKSE